MIRTAALLFVALAAPVSAAEFKSHPPMRTLPTPGDRAKTYNLFWSTTDGPNFKGDFFATVRRSKNFELSKKTYAGGWGAHDLFADPKFAKFGMWGDHTADYRLAEGSPATDAGTDLPNEWPDPLRKADAGKPDLGALPLGAEVFKVGPSAANRR